MVIFIEVKTVNAKIVDEVLLRFSWFCTIFMTLMLNCRLFEQVSSVEIERICNAVDSSVLETAAIGVPPADGGPERLVIAVVFKDPENSTTADLNQLRISFNSAVQKNLNPLFRVSCCVIFPSNDKFVIDIPE